MGPRRGDSQSIRRAGLSVKTGQTHVQQYMPELLATILAKKLDTTFVISHRLALPEATRRCPLYPPNRNDFSRPCLLSRRGPGRIRSTL